ncbi:MAG: thiamine pyrophosphate-binding protein [bacterium]|nr:thiamine pyrophosphate-binding protein [bacterium]
MDVYHCIIKTLENIGVTHVFGGSGQANATMLLALKDSDKIEPVIVRNEQAASFMACGYSMFNDNLGVCFATGGPGAFNLFSGLAVALSDSLPVLALSGYPSIANRGKGPLNGSSGLNRTPDSHKMFLATTKNSYIIEDPAQTCDILEDALNTALGGRPGPVHIHVPKNLTIAEVPNYREIKLNIKPVLAEPAQIDLFADVLAKAIANNEPVMALVGYGCIRSHAQKELLTLIEKYQIPFASTMDAKGFMPENHPLALGVLGTSGSPGAREYFDKSTHVLTMGNSFAQNATYAYKADLYEGKKLLHINIDENELDKVYKADYKMISDIKPALNGILDNLAKSSLAPQSPTVPKDHWYTRPTEATDRIHPADLVKAISKNLPADSIILGDAGAHMLWLNCYLELNQNQRYQNPGSFGPMASSTNGAIGIKCANPDKHVISGSGDGCYLMAGFELLTAVQHNIPVIWIIFNNGEFNIIKKFLMNMFGKHAYLQFENPDYLKYAEACKAHAYRVEKIEDFEPAFKKALDSNKPALIDVVVSQDVYPPFSLAKV